MGNTKDGDKIEVTGLNKSELEARGYYFRGDDKLASTEFTYTRFLSPALNDFTGLCVFCDSDFLWECDIYEELAPYFDKMVKDKLAISCVKHNYVPDSAMKMDGRIQTVYPRKNWSSLILFNCDHPEVHNLTIENVNRKDAGWLHRMQWCSDENIGELPHTYNYLVGVYHDNIDPKVIHYTDGGPWHYLYRYTEFAEKWLKYLTDDELVKLEHELQRQESSLLATTGRSPYSL